MKFVSNDVNARFYMDGLDSLPIKLVETDEEGEAFLPSSSDPVTLFDYPKNSEPHKSEDEFYPFVPGHYRIRVVSQGIHYYSWIQILPKQIQVTQWELMKDEVESLLNGLALDLIRQNLDDRTSLAGQGIPSHLFMQFMIIQRHFPTVTAALNDLLDKVNFQIKKMYRTVPVAHSKMIDEVTIKHRLTHPEKRDVLKAPHRIFDVDLPENRLLKTIIRSVINTLTQFEEGLIQYRNETKNELDMIPRKSAFYREKEKTLKILDDYQIVTRKMKATFRRIQSAHWYNKISDTPGLNISHVMISDVRYRAVYQLYRDLEQNDVEITLDHSYKYQWKRTDKLYEIWGIIQLIKLLSRDPLGYRPVQGWIYNPAFDKQRLLIPSLPSGEKIIFEKDNIHLHLTYDGIIPSDSKHTDPYNIPVYSWGTNNRPDVRLDLYQEDTYIGGIVMDFKYRPKWRIWNQKLISSNRQSDTMKQLINYGSQFYSTHKYDGKRGPAIRQVWAFYPEKEPKGKAEFFHDRNFLLLPLSPGSDNYHVIDWFVKAIQQLKQEYQEYYSTPQLAR
ncbi:DUF2357 domain-containing protein [Kroppenstedtia pulmonis]|uniref:DUF2357 domain-containing protein n=1 Tax=Kroppenstedtia pulmonis TaxID=1380685 RepID=A0A7D4B1H9_9BACL|nr:DUF2357 domain-containing protein [Kroppenstedtia pulmonis]